MKILDKELSDEVVIEIGKFTILWAEFEKVYCGCKCCLAKIWDLKNKLIINKNKLLKYNQVLQGRLNYFNEDFECYVDYNLIPKKAIPPNNEDKKAMKDFINLDELVKEYWSCGALLCIYRIRNNLLHGLKNIDELDGQIELFRAMNAVLENIRRR
jgi:hypothetical protein